MIIEENTNKKGYGSWYCTQRFDDEAKTQFDNASSYFKRIKEETFKRVQKEVKEGDHVKLRYVGGKKPYWRKGIIEHIDYSIYGGYIHLKQPKTVKVLDTCFIDEIEILN